MPYFSVDNSPLSPIWHRLGYKNFYTLPAGIALTGGIHPTSQVKFLADLTWLDESGNRQLSHVIFDEMLAMIRGARKMIVVDVFLFNDLLNRGDASVRPICRELTDLLIARKREVPDLLIYFISDPCNTVYGGLRSPYFEAMRDAGIQVVLTEIDSLRDSNPVYTFLWRLLVRPFGVKPGGLMPNPFGGGGRIPIRGFLQIFNIKANHRKTLIADAGDEWQAMVSTANPHDASYANRNVGVQFCGPAVSDLFRSECAVLELSGVTPPNPAMTHPPQQGDVTVQVVTERKIKEAVLDTIDRTQAGDTLDMILFYLADREIVRAIYLAKARGVVMRVVLDPNKDAFGWSKTGIPNRPVAFRLNKRDIPVRWADTHGEQCHSKMLLARLSNGTATLIEGSANFTRRNMDNFNLEADVVVRGPANASALAEAKDMFELVWENKDHKQFTVDYDVYRARSILLHWAYWLMEKTGISTF